MICAPGWACHLWVEWHDESGSLYLHSQPLSPLLVYELAVVGCVVYERRDESGPFLFYFLLYLHLFALTLSVLLIYEAICAMLIDHAHQSECASHTHWPWAAHSWTASVLILWCFWTHSRHCRPMSDAMRAGFILFWSSPSFIYLHSVLCVIHLWSNMYLAQRQHIQEGVCSWASTPKHAQQRAWFNCNFYPLPPSRCFSVLCLLPITCPIFILMHILTCHCTRSWFTKQSTCCRCGGVWLNLVQNMSSILLPIFVVALKWLHYPSLLS